MGKDAKRRRRSRSPRARGGRPSPPPPAERLRVAAALNDVPAVRAALAAGGDARRSADGAGWSALHAAAAADAADAVVALLDAGASLRATDAHGNTPAHAAAAAGALASLAALLTAPRRRGRRPVDPDAKNDAGLTVDALAEAAMARADEGDRVADRVALEQDWEDRLRAAADDDGELEWGERWWGAPDDGETEDAHAARVFAELERRAAAARASVRGATAAHWRETGAARVGPPPRPRAFVDAVAAAAPTALRAAHEAAWAAFARTAAAAAPGSLPASAVPLPPGATAKARVAILIAGEEADERRAARGALRRWHPDKAFAVVGAALAPGPAADRVRAAVTEIAAELAAVATG